MTTAQGGDISKGASDGLVASLLAREAVVGVVGLGYVGLPAALAFAEAGFRVVGVDTDRERVEAVKQGRSFTHDVAHDRVARAKKARRLTASMYYRALNDADAILLCLPTPLNKGAPDLSSLVSGSRAVTRVLRPGTLVVVESTTYPGCTEELLLPLFEEGGLQAGRDFALAYSPERLDPGNSAYTFADIPKVVGGINADSTKAATALYEQVVPLVVTVSGTREAELTKLIENTFRHVNIALVNELALYAKDMNVDIWEAIEAAATKPFGYLPFWPGPGWGGHCIPLDPAYLSWRVRQDRAHAVRFVELADEVNSRMPHYVVERVSLLLNERAIPLRGSKILGVGLGYKGGTSDTRGSPGLKILTMLAGEGVEVSYHDPLVPQVTIGERRLESVPLARKEICKPDLVVTFVPQSKVSWERIERHARFVLDCCNVMGQGAGKVVRL